MADFRLNFKGGAEVLRSEWITAQVNAVAHSVADDIGDEADVDEYTTDRSAASVSVPAALQATDGALTRAAAKLGLEVKPQ